MHFIYLFTLFTLLVPLSLSQTTFYIDETSKTRNPYGSLSNPFTSLDDAALRLYAGTFNIILLGQSITITSPVIFPSGSICIIRPQTIPESGYFPLKIGIGASISVLQTNVTFQNIQFVELDPFRNPADKVITISAGFLFLNRILVSDIQYEDSPYVFISAGEDSVSRTGLILFDTEWKNLVNVQIFTTQAQVTVKNASFYNIEMNNGAFLTLYSSNGPKNNLEMLNISLKNAMFGYKENQDSVGFVQILESSVNVSIDVFSARNISIMNGVSLIGIKDQEEGLENPITVEIWDVVLEDIVEIEEEQMTEGIGLIFDIEGPGELTLKNLTARNVKFENGSLLRYLPDTSQFLFKYDVLPKVSLQDIKIENSSNTNFLIFWLDGGQVENVELMNVESKTFPVFYFQNAGAVSIENVFGSNFSGSFITLSEVFSQDLENFKFENVSTSQENSFILLTRDSNITTLGLRASAGQSTVIADFFIDGYEYIGAEDQENQAYLMTIKAEIGMVLIRDSTWRNINKGGLFSPNINALKVDNLTVSGTSSQAAEILRFEYFDFVEIANSRFENNENQRIVFVEVPDDAENMTMGFMVSFENIAVVNNSAKSFEENNSSLSSNLFEFKSPKKAIQANFLNCLFQDNDISGSILKVTESQSVNISMENNTFLRNYARGAGGIFSTENMQQNTSLLTANNNAFQDNFCQDNGGIFYFLDSWYQVFLSNNTYRNNTSAENGGIGYILRSSISFLEQDALYSDNTAEKDGGLWFIRSSNQLQQLQPPITFTNVFFNSSRSGSNGGAFYLLYGNLTINSSLFTRSQAEESGGVFYLEAFSSLFINGSVFQETIAPEGSLAFAASLVNSSIVLQGVSISNTRASGGTLVDVNSGFVLVNDSAISGISGQLLFDLKGSSAKFDGARISDIDCSEVKEACVLNGESVELEWEDTDIRDVVLQGDLVVLDENSVMKGEVITVNITKIE